MAQATTLPEVDVYSDTILEALALGGIESAARITVTPDLQASSPVAGGLANHTTIYLDAKLLDIFAEYSTWVSLAQLGRTSVTRTIALDSIVASHNSYYGVSAPRVIFPDVELGDLVSRDVARTNFRELVGGILFHEHGHIWTWACVDNITASWVSPGLIYSWPSRAEDEADLVMGILSAKAGFVYERVADVVDIMAFQALHRVGQSFSIDQVEYDYSLQFGQQSTRYQSLYGRKSTIRRGCDNYSLYGR